MTWDTLQVLQSSKLTTKQGLSLCGFQVVDSQRCLAVSNVPWPSVACPHVVPAGPVLLSCRFAAGGVSDRGSQGQCESQTEASNACPCCALLLLCVCSCSG